MALLTRNDLRRQSLVTWASVLALLAVIAWFWSIDKRNAAEGTALALLGCLGLVLPPRERMDVLPWRLRALPRPLDAAPILGTLITSPGYGVNWFYGENPYDEIVHLVNGLFAGAILIALLQADGAKRTPFRRALAGAVFGFLLGAAWEVFEALVRIGGDWTDTWTDVALTMLGSTLAAWLAGPWLVGKAVADRVRRP